MSTFPMFVITSNVWREAYLSVALGQPTLLAPLPVCQVDVTDVSKLCRKKRWRKDWLFIFCLARFVDWLLVYWTSKESFAALARLNIVVGGLFMECVVAHYQLYWQIINECPNVWRSKLGYVSFALVTFAPTLIVTFAPTHLTLLLPPRSTFAPTNLYHLTPNIKLVVLVQNTALQ